MKKSVLFFALIVGLLTSASTMQAQVNMSRYITLTVTNGAAIKLNFAAASAGTPVRIVSGSNTQDITVGTSWYGFANYTAGSTTMTVYGNIIGFNCSENGANLTALDVSHNTQLAWLYCYSNKLSSLDVSHNTQLTGLYCYGNNFTTAALDDIFCALPVRQASDNARIQPVYSDTSSNHAIVLATNKANAIAKNWKVQYYKNDADIPATTGSYVCPQLNMSRYITLTVANGAAIKLDFAAAAANTPVRIVSGSNTQDITVGTGWKGTAYYTAGSTTMTVYGDLKGFDCSDNGANLTALDLSNNTQLEKLSCSNNQLSSLDISHNTQLTGLNCSNNQLSSLDISHNTQLTNLWYEENNLSNLDLSNNTKLTELNCRKNNLSSLDISKNTKLIWLYCDNNNLTNLDISHNTQLTWLYCYHNNLTALDVSRNTQLEELYCWGNNFTTDALDDIYCALPDRTGKYSGKIFPLCDTSSVAEQAIVKATNAANATAKNWKVRKYVNVLNNTDITTTGTYVCQANTSRYITLTVKNGKAIQFDLRAAAAGTPVRIVSGSNTQDITIGTGWKICPSYTADGTTMTVYGDIIGFNCYNNGENITGLDLSHNTQLTELYCSSNRLTSLDVSGCTRLMRLGCTDNRLTGLDLSHNTQLTELNCTNNRLSSLDLSHNTKLTKLYCYKNKFSTQALDRIYCTLPDRDASDDAKVFPLHETSSTAEADAVGATTVENATDKNWKVQTYKANHQHEDIATTGTYDCSTAVAEATAEQALTLYPNPVADVLYLSATARTIRIYNIYGIEVAHATDTDRVEVSHLPAGIYTVKADGTVAKMVKR